MCELLGFSADHDVTLNEWLGEFYSHSVDHPHGWGISIFNNDGSAFLRKGPERAVDSMELHSILGQEIRTKCLMAHIRYATVGKLTYENSHPFTACDKTGRRWTFEHNGTLLHARGLDRYRDRQEGTTDSERLFLYMMDRVNEENESLGRAMTDQERFRLMEGIIGRISKGNKLNLIFHDGEYLYVHVNHRKNMHVFCGEGYTLFATRPLVRAASRAEGAAGGSWKELPLCRLYVYRDGKRVFTGRNHCHEHEFTPEDIESMKESAAMAAGNNII